MFVRGISNEGPPSSNFDPRLRQVNKTPGLIQKMSPEYEYDVAVSAGYDLCGKSLDFDSSPAKSAKVIVDPGLCGKTYTLPYRPRVDFPDQALM